MGERSEQERLEKLKIYKNHLNDIMTECLIEAKYILDVSYTGGEPEVVAIAVALFNARDK